MLARSLASETGIMSISFSVKSKVHKTLPRVLRFVRMVVTFMPLVTLAAPIKPPPLVKTLDELKLNVFCNAMLWLFTFAIVVSVIFIILAAFKYLTASGDEEKFNEAHRALIYGAVGIAVAIIARGVPYIVGDFFGGDITIPPIGGNPGGNTGSFFFDPCAQ